MAQKDLIPFERQLIKEYLKPTNGFNGTQAYLTLKPNVSRHTAGVNACKILNKPHVKQAIQEYQDDQIVNEIASKNYLIKEAHEIGQLAKTQDKLNTALSAVEAKAKLNQIYAQDTQGQEDYGNLLSKLVVINGDVTLNQQNNMTLQESDSPARTDG